MPGEHADVFVSYSTRNKTVADAVVAALETNDLRCWYAPRDVEAGDDWGDAITRAIQGCKVLVLIFSGDSNQSKRVRDEIYVALSEECTIIPFRIEKLDPTGAMRLHLARRHWLDAYDPSWSKHLDRLVKTVADNIEGRATGEAAGRPSQPPAVAPTPWYRRRWPWAGVAAALALAIGGTLWAISGGDAGDTPTTLAAASTTVPDTTTPSTSVATTTTSIPGAALLPTEDGETVVLDSYLIDPPTPIQLDPHIWSNVESIAITANLFLNLTGYDPESGEIVPEAAKSWTISTDGRVYTFRLIPDIPWVIHAPGGETVRATDENGDPLYVTAQDFVNGIVRLCDPSIDADGNAWFGEFFLDVIDGCREMVEHEGPVPADSPLRDAIGARALDDTELVIELAQPSGFFLTMSTMAQLTAVPTWAIERYGDAWTNPGILPTNGHFVIDEWTPGERVVLARNGLLPAAAFGTGNLDAVDLRLVDDLDEAWARFHSAFGQTTGDIAANSDSLDYVQLPGNEDPDQWDVTTLTRPSVQYIGFDMSRPPFDSEVTRRAFAMAFDRDSYVEYLLGGQGVPMIHLAPPGTIGAPPIDEAGHGYDPDQAREVLAAAGHEACSGLGDVRYYGGASPSEPESEALSDFLAAWGNDLGCPAGTIQVTTDFDGAELARIGWGADYPDEHNWVGDAMWCERAGLLPRPSCTDTDELIAEAARTTDQAQRATLYRQVEEAFFGVNGEFPVIPTHWVADYVLLQPWLQRPLRTGVVDRYHTWSIDAEQKASWLEG